MENTQLSFLMMDSFWGLLSLGHGKESGNLSTTQVSLLHVVGSAQQVLDG
jgi:hypothetical protein